MLLAEQKLGGKSYFLLPQGQLGAGETSLRQTAERVLRETVGDSLQVTFYGNAPVGFYKYKYPAAAKRDAVGAKVFFFRCVLKEGSPNVGEKSVKVQWLDQGELAKTLQEPYYRSVSQFLL